MLHDLMVVLFAVTAGFTASGIVANVYRILAKAKPDSMGGRIVYLAVMVIAGPSVLFENAAKATREKAAPSVAFWLAAAISGYWSFALGLLVMQFALSLR